MKRFARSNSTRSAQDGAILIVVLVLSIVVSLTIAAAVMSSTTMGRNSQNLLEQTDNLARAEGVTDVVQKDMLDKVANFKPFALSGTVALDGVNHPYTITAIGSQIVRPDSDGVQLAIQPYVISSTVSSTSASATVNRIVDLTMTPIFQYMIFYRDDLEILPGPNMVLEGRVHSNGSIYVGVGAGATLLVDTDYFRCTGDIRRDRKNDNTVSTGTVQIKVFEETNYAAMSPGSDSDNPDWLNISNDTWKGTVQDGAHGVREVAAPEIGSIKAFTDPAKTQKGYYHENADLVLVDGQAFQKGSSSPLLLPPGTIMQRTMYDAREGRNVTVTDVDVGLLNGSGYFPANGLIYAYRSDATSSQPNGVRLSNARELLAPMTLVSEDPVYIKGDYNTVNKKGSAVIADAVNLLSNAWNDSKSAGTLPVATATTYNLAMVTGIVPTPDGGGPYSGGFENLPRFHENWSGVTARIRGAFANLYDSEIADGAWRYGGDVYTAPVRDWRYDPDLMNLDNMPPFTPNAVYFRRVLWDDTLPSPLF